MTYVTCLGCNRNCDIDTENLYDNGSTYEAWTSCPTGFFVEIDEEEAQRAWNEDNGVKE